MSRRAGIQHPYSFFDWGKRLGNRYKRCSNNLGYFAKVNKGLLAQGTFRRVPSTRVNPADVLIESVGVLMFLI